MSILVAGSVPFDTPWLTDQNLATALSERGDVVYVEPPISPLTPLRAGHGGQSLRERLAPLRDHRVRRRGDVIVTRTLALPPLENRLSRRVSAPLLRWQVDRRLSQLDRSIDYVVLGKRLPVTHTGRVVCQLVKDWTPAGADLLGRSRADLIQEIVDLASSADIVCTISDALRRKLAEHGIESHVLRHGFHANLASSYDDAEMPADLAALPAPRFLYSGRIDARLDLAMLGALADHFPDGSVVLIGPVSARLPDDPVTRTLLARGNVHLLGSRDRAALPAYLVHADVLLLPYMKREWLEFGSPLKMWDYLYAGPPLVGSGCTVLREYPPPLVHFVDDPGDFPAEVERALALDRADASERRAFALANTWDHRADQLLALLREADGQRAQ